MMKKILSLTMVIILTMAMFAGCAKDEEKPSTAGDSTNSSSSSSEKKEKKEVEEITLGIWDENQKDAIQDIVDAFNAKNESIHATIELTPWSSYWTKLDAAAGAGEAPDVFWMNVYLPKYVDGGVLLPMDEYIARDNVNTGDYVEAIVNTYNYEGQQWAMPKGIDSVAVAYNKAIFDQYGVEYPQDGWTWDDMVAIAEELKAAIAAANGSEYPILMELDAQPSHFNFAHQTGGYIINEDFTKSGYNQPETVEAYQNVVDLLDQELLAPYIVLSETKGTDLFLSGKGAIVFLGSWKATVLEESTMGQEGNVGLITMPTQNQSNASVLGGLGYSIFGNTDHPDAAWELVKFLTGPVGNKIQGEAGIDIPAHKESQQYYLNNFANIETGIFFDAADNAVPFPAGPTLTKWLGPVNDYAAQIFAGEITAEEGCAKIYEEMQKIIDEE